jgi:nitric oxide synthase oxygenase domain/subunit
MRVLIFVVVASILYMPGSSANAENFIDCAEVTMPEKINDALLKRLEAAKEAGQQRIPVIVTLTPGADVALIEKKGLKRISQHVPLYAGDLTAAEIHEIAHWDQVERIEYDDKAWVL